MVLSPADLCPAAAGRHLTAIFSEATAQGIDQEVRRLLDAAHALARDVLSAKRAILDAIAGELLDKETLNKDEVLEIFAPIVKRQARAVMTANGRRPPSTLSKRWCAKCFAPSSSNGSTTICPSWSTNM